MSTVSEITRRTIFTGMRILAEHGNGLRARELWPLIVEELPSIDEARDTVRTGRTTAETNFLWSTVDLVKAGWLRKTDGRWHVTSVGRQALAEWPDAQRFHREARERYVFWDRHKDQFELAKQLVAAVPEGNWAYIEEVAGEAELPPERLAYWLQGERPEGWHRLLGAQGEPPSVVGLDEEERRAWLDLLDEDGIETAEGRARAVDRLPGSDLRQLIDSEDDDSLAEVTRRAWLIRGSSVQGVNLVKVLWRTSGVVSLPATRLRDLPAGASRDRVKAAIDADYSTSSVRDRARLTAEYHAFLSRMNVGDVVVTNDGNDLFVGVIKGGPAFVTSVDKLANLQRRVDWRNVESPYAFDDLPPEVYNRVSNPDDEVIELTDFLGDLEALLGEEPVEPRTPRPVELPDLDETVAGRLFVRPEWLREIVELLRERPQLIFYGPPGTGKTFLALAIAERLVGENPERVQLVQFHPAYSYEDFFEGYRPRASEDGAVGFELARGPLRRIADAARAHPDQPYVLVIDEINRGALAKIFGELYFLLEYRNRSVNLLYGSDDGKGFSLPENVIILGTMNTADRSIALVDAAMRRRFWFVELHPDKEPVRGLLGRWLAENERSDEPDRLLNELNSRIEDRDFRIGPAYLMRKSAEDEAGLERIWRTQILPLLEEHHYGDGIDVPKRYGLAALRARLS